MLSPFECLCGNFILPEPASYVFFYAVFNLRNLLYIIAECNAELELAQKQLRQYQNREKVLTRKLFVEERRIRTHRLCARGGYLESIVPELIAMTDEEAKDYLYHAVHSEEAKAFLKKRAEGGVTE